MTRRSFCIFIWIISLLLKQSSGTCKCEIYHTQERLCRAPFIAQVGVYGNQVKYDSPDDSRFHGLGKAHIYKILKGKYEDFRENSDISIVTPNGDCEARPLNGVMLIAGYVLEVGVVVLDACSLRTKGLSATQLMTIQHNIRTRAYNRGCNECNIRKVYDFSYLYSDECRSFYEYPISTSACVRNGKSGRCEWIRRSGVRHTNSYDCNHTTGRPHTTSPPKHDWTPPNIPPTEQSPPLTEIPPTEESPPKTEIPPTEESLPLTEIPPTEESPPKTEVPDGVGMSSNHVVLLHNLRSRLLRIVVNASWPHKV